MKVDTVSASDLTIHTVLGTFPQSHETLFDQKIRLEYYDNFRKESIHFLRNLDIENEYVHKCKDGTEVPFLYNPIRYHILGNYDIAYISLIDNLKFAQRLFESSPGPVTKVNKNVFSPHTFQSFTGLTHHSSEDLKNFFIEQLMPFSSKRKFFLGISNLKLNNGFLIGAGSEFVNSVIHRIALAIDEYNSKATPDTSIAYIIQQSFSWFELSLLLFTNDTESIGRLLAILRGLRLCDLKNYDQIVVNSLYKDLFNGIPDHELLEVNLLADTHTYIGIHSDLICSDNKVSDSFVNDFKTKAESITLQTQIEWQVKPGHMHRLIDILKERFKGTNSGFKLRKRYLLAGKTDYFLVEKSNKVYTNYEIFRMLYEKKPDIFNHIRKIRTKVFFEHPPKLQTKKDKRKILDPHRELLFLTKENPAIKKIDRLLKEMKISRLIKSKILKLYTNFNNGIQDPILYPYFLDFCVYMDRLENMIIKEHEEWQKSIVQSPLKLRTYLSEISRGGNTTVISEANAVDDIEKKLIKRIREFEDAFTLRMMNCYQFEDITDFDLDFNASVQQLLSLYSNLVIETANLFYSFDERNKRGLLVQLNLKDTQANYTSINYHIHHLIAPEFVFATVTKEILNNEIYDNSLVKDIFERHQLMKVSCQKRNPYLYIMLDQGDADVLYFLNDIIRFAVTYDFNFELFFYWFWNYNLQNSLLFDKRGLMNERHFKKELFRTLLLVKFFELEDVKLYPPIEELATYWDRHFDDLNELAADYIEIMENSELLTRIREYFISHFNGHLNYLFPVQRENQSIKTTIAESNAKRLGKLFIDKGLKIDGLKNYYAMHEALRDFEINGPSNKLTINQELHLLMKIHLFNIYKISSGSIHFLRRNWDTGRPLESFIRANLGNHLYCVDQTGGVFFDNKEGLRQYMKMNSKMICRLLDISLKLKKQFILSRK